MKFLKPFDALILSKNCDRVVEALRYKNICALFEQTTYELSNQIM